MATKDIVAKLWSLCDILRDDGITYHQYVTELTLLLFLKMAKETDTESRLPADLRWDTLKAKAGVDQLKFYKTMLIELAEARNRVVAGIYTNASTALRQPKHLNQLVTSIDELDWYSAREDGLGDLYEGLLQKNANETKSGAGQYFTPRPLIDSMVALVKPQHGEVIQDPAAGTGGFLIAANEHVKRATYDFADLDERQIRFQKERALVGIELVPETRRLALMNGMLHGIDGPAGQDGYIQLDDALSAAGAALPLADVILTNPPFGTKKGGGRPTRDDFSFPTSNKQLAFLQHIYRGLKKGGRAAVVLPDNVLFEDGVGRDIRADLMDKCDLHTILRLPTGIFYAQGVKTNVLFFTRGQTEKGNTKHVWVYDLRTNAPSFGKRTPFTREYLAPFEKAFGADPHGKSKRKDEGEEGRFRKFTREDIAARGDNLDLAWLADDDATHADDLPEPEVLAEEIRGELQGALEEIEALVAVLAGDEVAA